MDRGSEKTWRVCSFYSDCDVDSIRYFASDAISTIQNQKQSFTASEFANKSVKKVASIEKKYEPPDW